MTFNRRIRKCWKKYDLKFAVAKDEAFCFYYEDNLRILKNLGAEIIYFSPMADKEIPQADGIILWGGYPELYAEKLSRNESIRKSVKSAIESGIPCIAECGGFLYLHNTLEDTEEKALISMNSTTGRVIVMTIHSTPKSLTETRSISAYM